MENLNYNCKYSRKELLEMNSIDVYKLVLNSNYVKQFPMRFWDRCSEDKQEVIEIVKWLIEEHLNLTRSKLLEEWNINFIKKYKLNGMIVLLFNSSTFTLIDFVYPGRYKEWEFCCVPMNFWTKENGAKAIRWLFDTKLKYNREQVLGSVSRQLFIDNRLTGMVDRAFKNSIFDAVIYAYNGEFIPSNFKWYRGQVYK